ncbi:MAG TPA: branched-chain amino acid transaminase [Thermomicrobiales bacterium]|nr:branched-chain amino acid transaminase [Thermomicrobiales bacterium]
MAQTHPKYLWWNGTQMPWEDATVHVTDLAWSTVGAVFEGIRGYWNAEEQELYIFRLPEHMQRLTESVRLVRLPLEYSAGQLIDATLTLLRDNDSREDTYIRPLAYSANTSGKRISDANVELGMLINTNPMPSQLSSGRTLRLKVSSWTRISDNVMPPRIKNISNYRNGQLASMEAQQDGYDNALLLGPHGKVSEAPGACVMMVRKGALITPPVTDGILESITRDAVLRMASEALDMPVTERSIDRTELYLADEVFLCGTAFEVSPVVEIDHYTIGSGEIGAFTGRLQALFEVVLRGTESRFAEWRTPVGVAAGAAAG